MMRFEWDDQKNAANIKKHGLNFADAWQVFGYPHLVELDEREDYGEDRCVTIGMLGTTIVALVFVDQDPDIARIISFRKAVKHERTRYQKFIQNRLGTA